MRRHITLVTILLTLPFVYVVSCGGGGGGGDPGGEPQGLALTVHESSATTFRASVSFGAPSVTTREAAGEVFSVLECEGCRASAMNDGAPGIPILTRLLAVPHGARLVVSEVTPVVSEVRTLLLHPYQVQEGDYSPAFEQEGPIPLDEEDWEAPFAYDRSEYAQNDAYPPDPVRASPPNAARDLSVAVLRIAAGRYAAATRELTLFSRVDFTIQFEGGTGAFLRNASGNPFDEGSSTAAASVWNRSAIEAAPSYQTPSFLCHGEELLILTHPSYRAAADRLAAHKNGRGLFTTVVTVNDGPGAGGPDTKEQIKAFLDARQDSCLVHYSYLLLLGDAADIEPWVLPRRYKVDDFPSDFPYAQIDTDPLADDLFPEVAVGRIPVGSLAEADVVVDKIIQYESNPPLVLPGGPFYGRAAIASYFQPGEGGSPANVENKRRFFQDSEEVRGHLAGHGFTVERIYTAAHPLTPETAPRYYFGGTTPIPAPFRPEDNYPWDGDTQQIIDAFNAGKSLFFHLDHAGWSGWGHPSFSTGHLGSLTNGELLPLVLSDNCSSGAFDYSSGGFAESILRMSGGGAIGVLAFTRNSNNGVGKQFLVGVVDSLWPSAYPNIGDQKERHRLGDMLNHARSVMTVNYATADPTSQSYLVAWCYARMLTLFGDPTLAVWVKNPLELPIFGEDLVAGPALEFIYPYRGATITVFEDLADGLVPIGRAVVGEGGATTVEPMVAPTDVSKLRFFASGPGAVPVEVEVSTAGGP